MESNDKTISNGAVMQFNWRLTSSILAILVAALITTPVMAETYRWKDKDGKIHFGSTVPAEYADLPYDVINKSGLVVRRVEPFTQAPEVVEAAEKKEKQEKQNKDSRQEQSDRLLLIKYESDVAIQKALELELEQVGYDNMLINKSFANTNAAIIDKVRLAADQQRAGIEVSGAQTTELNRLYRSLEIDKAKLAAMGSRKEKVTERFKVELLRYQELVKKYDDTGNGKVPDKPEPSDPDSADPNAANPDVADPDSADPDAANQDSADQDQN